MKIAVWHNLPSGGGNRALHDQVTGLVGRGHHVEVWCPPTADRSFLPLGDLVEEHVVALGGTPAIRRGPLNRRLRPYHEVADAVEAMDRHCRACAEEINRGDFDLLLAHSCKFFHVTPIGRHVHLPKALYLQEPNRKLYEALPRLPWAALPARGARKAIEYGKWFFRDLVQIQGLRLKVREEFDNASEFDLILVNSMFSRESVLRAYGLDPKVCYLGIDTEAFRPTGAIKERYVVGLGNINSSKGVDVAVAGLGTIEEEGRPDLVWIGNYLTDSYLEGVQEQARRLGVRFHHRINVTHAELVDTLSRASAMIYTSRLEPFGYAPLEANACGTAVVGIAEGGIRETVVDGVNGSLVQGGDPAILGRAILDLVSDLDRAHAVGMAARRNVEVKWSLEGATLRLERHLSSLRPGDRDASPVAMVGDAESP